ncbi:MAG TPA: TraR/DksA C4-type zinc finger protein [Longimicrobiaceae bacterium]|nr:TraR/DksA C4-type zinc finger protein [Longimicrobiaceae bacterium]
MLQEQERARIEQSLLRERADALDAIEHFDERVADLRDRAGELTLYRSHPADIGSESNEQEQDFLLASVEGRRLYAIDEALSRLYKEPESFGICERCGRDIEVERLEIIPETRLCARCAREVEAGADANPREAGPPAA